MKAVAIDGVEQSRVEEVPKPSPAATEVLVRVQRVQLSVTECSLYRGAEVAHYDAVHERFEQDDTRLFGHEFCGVVTEVGDGVEQFEAGDRVFAPGKMPCTECAYCEAGYPHYCSNKRGLGYELPGALAEYTALPQEPLCKLPDGVSNAEGAAMQPMASALLCVLEADIAPGDVVAVVGTGVMGYQAGQLAYTQGASDVYAIDLRSRPLELAAERGLTPIDAREETAEDVIGDATDGIGADVVFEAVGGDQTVGTAGNDPLALAHRLVRRGGRIVQVGHIEGDLTLTPRVTRSKSVDWINPVTGVVTVGPNASTGELAAELVADGRVSMADFVTHELPGLESFERAVDVTLDKVEHDALGPAQMLVDD